jgi:hypothetical protein
MRNRKRRTAQPIFESMETRVVPSALSIQIHHEQAVSAHVGQMDNSAAQDKASQRENDKAMKLLHQQENQVHIRSLEHRPSALPTKAEQQAQETSSFVKSLESAL